MGKQLYDLAFFKGLATERGGVCLALEYHGIKGGLAFRCAKGHEFVGKPVHIVYKGHWCPMCGGQYYDEHQLSTFQILAKNKGGECLSTEYVGIFKYLAFRCSEGHEWKARGGNILHRQSWCPRCARAPTSDSKVGKLAQMREIAKDRAGRCLSSEYLGDKTKLLFECAAGHQWMASPNTIKRPHWCPTCGKGLAKGKTIKKEDHAP